MLANNFKNKLIFASKYWSLGNLASKHSFFIFVICQKKNVLARRSVSNEVITSKSCYRTDWTVEYMLFKTCKGFDATNHKGLFESKRLNNNCKLSFISYYLSYS